MIFHMEFPYLRTLPGVVRMLKSERLRWAALVDRQGCVRLVLEKLSGKPRRV